MVEPSPNWPSLFIPQHFTPPDDVTAHAWLPPALNRLPAGAEPTGAAAIVNVTVAVAVPLVAPVAVTVTEAVLAAVGVPETTPVPESIDNPAGNTPDVTA